MLWAIAFATPFFLFFGWLSDKIGRKWIMLTGMLLGVLLYRPIFSTFLQDTDSKEWIKTENKIIQEDRKTSVHASGSIVQRTAHYETPNGSKYSQVFSDTLRDNNAGAVRIFIDNPNPILINKQVNTSTYIWFTFLVWIMIVLVTMVYGPIAAFLVEMFPTKIRYTSMSLPYHIGNGVFGGLVPFIGLLLTTTYPGDPLVGLWYPIGVAALCFVIGAIYLNNKIDKDVTD
ncbi:hypothetical protein [Paraflavitalea speifideaquila]|uniref:hypothetical protein n=1 Tax=Paraflavitalea speifideaquila TaxID=3076558 RepID=UPI0028E344F2|nr:hypothetical protein [Paraflavitalea speifideiaquila]